MKYITSLFIALALVVSAAANTVTIDVNQLPESIKQQITQQAALQETKAKVAQYGEWVGLGKELGSAIDGGLSAVENHVDKIADTNVGKITMALIVYKVIGRELVHYISGIAFALTWVPIFMFILWRNHLVRRVLTSVTVDPTTKVKTKTYEVVNQKSYRSNEIPDGVGYGLVAGIFIVVNLFIFFA